MSCTIVQWLGMAWPRGVRTSKNVQTETFRKKAMGLNSMSNSVITSSLPLRPRSELKGFHPFSKELIFHQPHELTGRIPFLIAFLKRFFQYYR